MNRNNPLIPRSKAITSWDLMEELIDLILSEVNRIAMEVSILDLNKPHSELKIGGHDIKAPACNTQGCLGGWSALIRPMKGFYYNENGLSLYKVAKALFPLELFNEVHSSLFNGERTFSNGERSFERLYPWPSEVLSQQEYAEAVVANVRKFMSRNETALKGFILPPIED